MNDEYDKIKEYSDIVEIARLYYEKNYDQKQIAVMKNKSQSEISKILKSAREDNSIEILVVTKKDFELDQQLQDRFKHLQEVKICFPSYSDSENDILETLGYEGAKYLIKNT